MVLMELELTSPILATFFFVLMDNVLNILEMGVGLSIALYSEKYSTWSRLTLLSGQHIPIGILVSLENSVVS